MCAPFCTRPSQGSTVGGKQTAVEVPARSALKYHKRFMREVGESDQLLDSSWIKSRKWYVAVLNCFTRIAVTNSYLLHKELYGRLEQQPMMQKPFLEKLTTELCAVPPQPVPISHWHIPVAIIEGASG